jgi:2-polyprenyl-3-methyl-5-hydroxy-6-metoxy-1,4-benzoquinol methylase
MKNENLEKDMKRFYSFSKPYMHQLKTHSLYEYSKYLAKILRFVRKGGRILDIGCGTGQVANYLAKRGYDVTGIDLSPLFVKEAANSGDAKFKVMDSTSLKFKDSTFDAVISAETLEHIPNPAKALSEMTRVLKPRGLIVLRFPNKQSKFKNFVTILTKKPLFKIISPNLAKEVFGEDEDLCYIASTSDVVVFLKRKGFRILYTKPFFWPSALIIARKP